MSHERTASHRPPGGGYQDLRVWHTALELATECYQRTATFPDPERFGLTAQMRRAAVSVVSNIAEGHGRGSKAAFASFLSIPRGSTKELEAQAILAVRLGFATDTEMRHLSSLCASTAQMLYALRRSLGRDSGAPIPPPATPDAPT